MHVIAIGADTETKRGKPITFQFYSEDLEHKEEVILWIKNPQTASKRFFAYLDSLPKTRDRHYIFFGHNLSFDFVSFFYDRHALLRNETIEGDWHGWHCKIVYAAVRFAEFRRGHCHVLFIDTAAYFPKKLEELGKLFCPSLPKLSAPKGLGQRDFKPSDKKFCAYAMRDSVIAYHAGKKILAFHREMDVPISVSAPHFASRVFRKHFMRDTIPLPPRKIVYSSLSAYHGGKNNLTVSPGLYKRVYSLDIRSAYPFAMSTFPSFSNPKLYKAISGNGNPKIPLPQFGVYCVSGYAKECAWPSLYNHSFKPLQKEFSGIWVTGFELNEALRKKEVECDYIRGYFYDADADTAHSAFKSYVKDFFERKDTATDKGYREFFKLLLNSLYGKFIQTRNYGAFSDLVYDLDEKKIIEESHILAGGLFNPFIACLITGHTRAYIHRLEHEYKALHTSTDGIFTQRKPKEIPGLGGLSIEAVGDLLLFRNKLYIFYSNVTSADRAQLRRKPRDGDKKIILSTIFRGKKIIKYAMHGFHGDLQTLERIYKTGVRDYEYTKVNKLRESLRRKLQVNDFVQTSATLNIDLSSKK